MRVSQGEPDGSHLYCRLAAFIDGEGMIAIERTAPSPRLQRRTSPRYQMYIRVVNTNELLMTWLLTNFGGSYRMRKSRDPKHKPPFFWTVADIKALAVLEKIQPFLVFKMDQCSNAIAFTRGYKKSQGRHPDGSRGILPDELARRHNHYLISRDLNHRGVAPAETKREGTE